jgi:EpsI family protein
LSRRALVLSVCLVLTWAYLAYAARPEPVAEREALAGLPLTIGDWKGRREPDFSPEILAVLRVDDYTSRTYRSSMGAVGFYAGYYASQRQDASIHSPLNCLPGAGWLPIEKGHVTLQVSDGTGSHRAIEINRVVIQKGLDRSVVLYWYQSHGRVVASEYLGKAYTVIDAIRYNRTDGALIRVVAPVADQGSASVAAAQRAAEAFAVAVFPELPRFVPY